MEIFSLSKGWNMTGWRIGWVAGNAEVVEHFRRLKTNLDSGMFDALQLAGVAALTEARDFPAEMSELYRRRRDLMIDALARIGLAGDAAAGDSVHLGSGARRLHVGDLHRARARPRRASSSRRGRPSARVARVTCAISLTVADERLEEAASRIATSLRVGAGA